MIKLSNGHVMEYVVASGALAFDGKGWLWDWPFRWLKLIKPEFFTVITKSLSLEPIKGNLCWWKLWTWLPWSPWSCVRFVEPKSAVNKVGLTNKGIHWWCKKIGPKIDRAKQAIIVSLYGTKDELVEMAQMLNSFDLVGVELNVSCPNTGHAMSQLEQIVESVKAVHATSRHPIILKLSVAQDYVEIAKALEGIIEALDFNSVPWEIAFHIGTGRYDKSPLLKLMQKLERKTGSTGGGGGVSGQAAQRDNWLAVRKVSAAVRRVPVIAPSIMKYSDIDQVFDFFGARAVSFGAIHMRKPWLPTRFVERRRKMR